MGDDNEMADMEALIETTKQWIIEDTAMHLARGLTGRDDITQEQAFEILHEVCRDVNQD